MDQRLLGVAAAGHERHDPAAVVEPAHHLGARHEGQRLAGEVVVGGLVGVGVVDAGRLHPQPLQITRWLRIGQLDELEHLGTAKLGHLDRTHARTLPAGRTARTAWPDGTAHWGTGG